MLPLCRTQILCHRHSSFFPKFFFLSKSKGRLGPSVCTNLSASVSAYIYKLAGQAIKYMPVTAGEMTGLPLSMVFPSRTSWMALSPDAAPCSGIPAAHGSRTAGTGSQLWLYWAQPLAAVAERQRRGALSCGGTCVCMCGAHHLPACNPKWKRPVEVSRSAWHLFSEVIKGLWAGYSITPPIFTDGKIKAQGSEIT